MEGNARVKEGEKKLIKRSPTPSPSLPPSEVSRGNDKKRDTLNAMRVVTLAAVPR